VQIQSIIVLISEVLGSDKCRVDCGGTAILCMHVQCKDENQMTHGVEIFVVPYCTFSVGFIDPHSTHGEKVREGNWSPGDRKTL